MADIKKLSRQFVQKLSNLWLIALLVTCLACGPKHIAQTTPPPPAVAGGEAGATQKSPPVETKISPQQSEELFRSVDEILKFASTDTALPIKQEVKRRLTSRDEVTAFVEKHMNEDEDAQRLRRSELVLKKFGLLPRDFNLQKFLLALLREQVAGYYDPKTKTVNLLDWIDTEQQKPVMAHELTHALQDQSFDLEKWMKPGEVDLAEGKGQPSSVDIDNDEISTARQAVVEGQAMAVLVDYELAPLRKSLVDSPQMVEALKQGMLVGTSDSPEFGNAPIYLKEALVFPYRYGLDFVVEMLKHGGKEKAFAGVFANPPHSSREIMEPGAYLSGEKITPMPVPDFDGIFKDYDRFDVGSIGEFDVAILIDQYAGASASQALYPAWRGGYYYAARPKGNPNAPLGLMYASRWADAEKAAAFAAIYAKSIPKRYEHAKEDVEGKSAPLNLDTLASLSGRHSWTTGEGAVVIEVQGDTVLVTESLEAATTEKLRQPVLKH